jgi:hypothetical protein
LGVVVDTEHAAATGGILQAAGCLPSQPLRHRTRQKLFGQYHSDALCVSSPLGEQGVTMPAGMMDG